jgi:heme exporter protein C
MLSSESNLIQGIFTDLENKHWFRSYSPQSFYPLAAKLVPWFAAAALLFCAVGLYLAFFVASAAAPQGAANRIAFIHVPAAWVSMLIYLVLAFYASVGLIYNARLPAMIAQALAPTGAMFAFLVLWTGCLWAKPIWGAWWVWDMRLISQMVLLLFYMGFIALQVAIDDPQLADKAGAWLALAGTVNIPINYFSAHWWTTLHQGASIRLSGAPGTALSILAATLAVAVGFWLYTCAVALLRLRCVILERERQSDWVATSGGASS